MTGYDTSFQIAGIDTFHLGLGGAYWEDYRRDEVASPTERFEFRGWRTVYARSSETMLARVALADGAVGWGEPNVPIGPEVVCLILDNVVAPLVAGRRFAHPAALRDFLYVAQRGRGYFSGYWLDALAALDIAVWDALGKRAGVPVAAMLGRAVRPELPVYLSGIRKATLRERADHVNSWIDSGLRGAKIFLTGDLDDGLSELAALRRAAPRMERWMVDMLWTLDDEAATRAKREFGQLGVDFLECPLPPEDLESHRALVRKPGAPIALGEHFRTSVQVRDWLGPPGALDVFQPDVGRTGISDGLRQLEAAEAAGISITPHMGNGVAVFQAATFQFAAVCPSGYLQEFQAGFYGKAAGLTDTGWVYRDGVFPLPDRPGLGVSVDEDKLERFLVRRPPA